MKLYFAGGETTSWLGAINKAKATKSLCSYFSLGAQLKKPDNIKKFIALSAMTQKHLFLDSGAFSAKTKGVKIDLDEYCRFIKEHQQHFAVYANLDVIGDYKGTMKNQRYMESKGLKPLPCYHYGEPIQVLKDMAAEYKYLAIGGLVPIAKNKAELTRFLDRVFSIVQNKVKIHGFGMTGQMILKRYPFYSVDSTSWLGGSMRAEVYKFDSATGTMNCLYTSSKDEVTPDSFLYTDQDDKRWMPRVINNAIEWMKFEKYITNLWKERGIEWN